MVKTMKRSLSMLLALLMLLCVFPVSAFAADETHTLVVGRNNAPFRTEAHNYGEIVKRYDEDKSLTYTRLYINNALNLWYGVPLYDSESDNFIERFIYSGNVKKISKPKGSIVAAQVEISADLLNQDTCRAQAKRLLDNGNTGYTELQMAKEIFAHACAFYATVPAVMEATKLYLTNEKLCELFPNQCVTISKVVEALVGIYKPFLKVNNKAVCVEIGEGSNVEGFTRVVLYEIWWDMVKAGKITITAQ